MPPGPAGAIAYVSGALQKFPDLHVAIDDMIAEGSRGGAESLDRYGFADRQEIGISQDCDLENCGAAICGAGGRIGKCRTRPAAGLMTTSVAATRISDGAILTRLPS
jgi:hypothetical protein